MGSVSSRTGVIALNGTDHGDNSDTVSENGTGHGPWVSLPVSERRTASAPSKTRGKSPRAHARAKPSTELDQQDMKIDLKRYKKFVMECQNQERIAIAKLQEVEKQLAEVEGVNLRLQDEVQLLEEKVGYLQEVGSDSQSHNYVEMLKMKDKYIQNLGKETHVIRSEVTQLKAKYKKKLKEKSSQISEMRQLHCIQMMEIKTEMEKLLEENENLSDQLSRSEQGHSADKPTEGTSTKQDDRRNDVIVQLSAKVSEQELRIIALENRLHQREKQLTQLLERTKTSSSPSRGKQELGDGGDTRRRQDRGTVDRHCQSEVFVADSDKRPSSGTLKHGSDSRLAGGLSHAWDDAAHDTKNSAKSAGDVIHHKSHAISYTRHGRRNHSYSSASDIDDEDGCWDDEDFSASGRRNSDFRKSAALDDPSGRHGHHGYAPRKNKNHNNDPSACDSAKQRHRQRERNISMADMDEAAGDSRHTSRSHTDIAHEHSNA